MISRSFLLTMVFFLATAAAHAGAWGHKSFDNDDALDWVENELKRGGQSAVEKTIAAVAKGRGYLQAPDGSAAIAACEVLAAAQGRASPDLPKDVAALAQRLSAKPSDAVRKNARDALDRILGKESELAGLWKDAGENFEKWKKAVEDLKSRV
ncbi:MAG TPA: DUF4259 domain-containing protein [Opitutaceae bacterium]